jgi:hypothetical protein
MVRAVRRAGALFKRDAGTLMVASCDRMALVRREPHRASNAP